MKKIFTKTPSKIALISGIISLCLIIGVGIWLLWGRSNAPVPELSPVPTQESQSETTKNENNQILGIVLICIGVTGIIANTGYIIYCNIKKQ